MVALHAYDPTVSADPASVTVVVRLTVAPSLIAVPGAPLMVRIGATFVTVMLELLASTLPLSSSEMVTVATYAPLSVGVKVSAAPVVLVPPGKAKALPFFVTLHE